jgi:hypothetical protein
MREDSGLPFIGSIFQTFSCVANMASDIKNTFSNLLGGSIAVPDAIRIFGIQVAGIYDMVNFMAMPALNTDPSGPAPSEPHTNAPSDNAGVSTETPEFQPLLLHLHPRQQRLTLVHRHQHPISTSSSVSGSSTSASSSSSSSASYPSCAEPTATDYPYLSKFYAGNSKCLGRKLCSATCEECLGDDMASSLGLQPRGE